MSDHADVIREWLSLDPRADWEATPDDFAEAVAALDALVAERDKARHLAQSRHGDVIRAEAALRDAQTERDEAISCLQRVVEADRDDSRMGYPNAGDSCIGACIGLDVMPWLDARGKLLPFVDRAALADVKEEE